MTSQQKKLTLKDIVLDGAEFLFSEKEFSFYEKGNFKYIVKDNKIIHTYHINDKNLRKYKKGKY